MPSDAVIEGRILEWGNSYGIRLRAADVRELGLEPGQDVTVEITLDRTPTDEIEDLASFQGGRDDVAENHDALLGDALSEDHVAEDDR